MKRISLLIIAATLTAFAGTSTVAAQTTMTDEEKDALWEAHATDVASVLTTDANNPTFVYLYNLQAHNFLTSGGTYGVQGTFANVGMRFYITTAKGTPTETTPSGPDIDGYYTIHSRFSNSDQGASVAFETADNNSTSIYLDRFAFYNDGSSIEYWNGSSTVTVSGKQSYPYWKFNGDKTAYSIQNGGDGSSTTSIHYGQYMVKSTTTSSTGLTAGKDFVEGSTTESNEWIIVTQDEYHRVITTNLQDECIDVSGLIMDSRFDRNNADVTYWKDADGNEASINNSWSNEYGQGAYNAAEVAYGGTVQQTITGLTPGKYTVTVQAAKRSSSATANLFVKVNGGEAKTSTISQSISSSDAVAAGQTFAGSDPYYKGEYDSSNDYYVAVEVEVTAASGSETGSITFGVQNENSSYYSVFFDNARLFWCGTKVYYLDANNTSTEEQTYNNGELTGLDHAAYTTAVAVQYRRAFTLGKWNAIVLPFNVSGEQLKRTFGSDVKLSKLEGINPATRINFKSVDLSSEGIEQGECYVIKVSQAPSLAAGQSQEYSYGHGSTVKLYGPLYSFGSVTRTETLTSATVSKDYTTANGTLNFTGYYTKPLTKVEAGYYIVKNGKMWYLTGSNTSIYGTYWTLKDADTNSSKSLTFSIDGDDNGTVTGIEGLIVEQAVGGDEAIFNLGGQRVSPASQAGKLPKGIYMLNGKKVIVK